MHDHGVAIDPRQSLAELATRYAGASRVFQRHGLDFCCRGGQSLRDACAARSLDQDAIAAELRHELVPIAATGRWDLQPIAQLLDHILHVYHEDHRRELPRLLAMASKVEQVHATSPDRPTGLADHLRAVAEALADHMQKEEQILFPMLRAGHGSHAAGPIQVMEADHDEHGRNLRRMRQLAHDYQPPASACATWRALYLGLEQLERDLMQHIHLENHVLFPRVLFDEHASG